MVEFKNVALEGGDSISPNRIHSLIQTNLNPYLSSLSPTFLLIDYTCPLQGAPTNKNRTKPHDSSYSLYTT